MPAGIESILTTTKPLLTGTTTTLELFALVIVISIPLGLGVTFLASGRNKVLRGIILVYVWIMRGTPLMLQLFFFCFGLPFLPVIGKYLVMDRFTAALLAFVFNYAAYFSEIFRGGLLSIDRGQYEAAQVLGFSKWQRTYHIILPQMFKVVLPSVANETITLVKDTALVTAIGVVELLHYAKTTVSRTADISSFIYAALIYLAITTVLTLVFKKLEKKYSF